MKERKVTVTIAADAPDDLKVDHTKLAAGETVELTERQARALEEQGFIAKPAKTEPDAEKPAAAEPAPKPIARGSTKKGRAK
jgi:hypothetical protein